MKKLLSIIISALLIFTSLSLFACSDGDKNPPVTYSVTVESVSNGTLSVDNETPVLGSAVNITATANGGYILYKLTINGNSVSPTLIDGNYTYVISSALMDYTIDAKFARPNVTIKFEGVAEAIADRTAVYNGAYGHLPQPFEVGKRFVGWKTVRGNIVDRDSTINSIGTIILTAQFEEYSETDIAGLTPDAITTTYYGSNAKAYGVTWHTTTAPSKPVIEVSKTADFEEAVEIECSYEEWYDLEKRTFSVYGVIGNLDAETQYFVRMGDKAIPEELRYPEEGNDSWSKVYNFTTKSDSLDSANFFFVNGTNQQYLPQYMSNAGEDYATADTYWSYVMKDAVARFGNADFIAHGGEMVDKTMQYGRWEAMVESVEDYLFTMPVMGTTGKVEVSNQSTTENPLRKSFSMMFNLDTPSIDTRTGAYYSFNYGPVHFVYIRTADIYAASRAGKNTQVMEMDDMQIKWLKADLKEASSNENIKWIVAVMNENPMDIDHEFRDTTNADKNMDFQEILQNDLLGIFDEYKVDLVLAGSPRNRAIVSTLPIAYSFGDKFTTIAGVTTENVVYDSEEVVKITAPSGEGAKHGVVYHQTGIAGSNYAPTGKEWDGTAGNLKPLQMGGVFGLDANIADFVHSAKYANGVYRKILSGAKGCIDDNANYSMYSYVEINGDTLVVRTYGVDVLGQSKLPAGSSVLSKGIYLDGFMLTK